MGGGRRGEEGRGERVKGRVRKRGRGRVRERMEKGGREG